MKDVCGSPCRAGASRGCEPAPHLAGTQTHQEPAAAPPWEALSVKRRGFGVRFSRLLRHQGVFTELVEILNFK